MTSVWLVDLTYTQQTVSTESMPYGVACLAAFAKHADPEVGVRIFKYPEKLITALETCPPPDVIGFSNYIWNSELSLGLAGVIRAELPGVVIVFGGPHYSLVDGERAAFLRAHPYVDFYVAGEGETPFAELLAGLENAGFRTEELHGQVPSVHSIDPDGRSHLMPLRDRMRGVDVLPAPYRLGLLDEFFDGSLVPVIQTNRGCPFSCTFCIEGTRYFTKISSNPVEEVGAELHYIGARMREVVAAGGRNELIITDSNFGMYPQDERICAVISDCQDAYGWPKYVYATTGKNRRDRVLTSIARTRGAIQLTGSVQSMDATVLGNVKRKSINVDTLIDQALEAKAKGADSYSDVILGLPGDSLESHSTSVRRLLDAGFGSLTMFQLSLLPGSELATPEHRAKFRMVTKFRVIPRCFGHYHALGHELCIAEIDEICTGLDTLSFEEYVDCRLLDFFVAILHNQGLFAVLEKYLTSRGLSIADWIETARRLEPAPGLRETIELFTAETRGHLYDDRRALTEHVRDPEVIRRYIEGELGNNEMYTYRAHALVHALPDLVALAFDAAHEVVRASGTALTPDETAFLADLRRYVLARCDGVFSLPARATVTVVLAHDVRTYEKDPDATVEECRHATPRRVDLALSSDQRRTLAGYAKTMGLDARSIGRALAKTRLHHFLRTVERDEHAIDAS
jgi:radical SAM superfamily enzyme YgiQ (UPF0313 family)